MELNQYKYDTNQYEYTINPFIIPKDGNFLDKIWLNFELDKLPTGYVWNDYFIFRYLKLIRIELDHLNFYETNGLFLKTQIDLQTPPEKMNLFTYCDTNDEDTLKYISNRPIKLFIPITLPFDLPLHKMMYNVKLHIEFNEQITTPIMTNLPIKTNILCSYSLNEKPNNVILQNNLELYHSYKPHCEKIKINKEYGYHYKHELKCLPRIRYLLFYIEGDIEIESMTISANDINCTYNYTQMNVLFPFINLPNLPMGNELFVPFTNNDLDGLAVSKIDRFVIHINFSKNDGGNVYIISEITNMISDINTHPIWRYSDHVKMDCWRLSDNSDNLCIENDHIEDIENIVLSICI